MGKAIRSRPQEAKTGKGLMNIFLDTVRQATLVDKDDRHRDHQELKAIWSSIVGFERRLCLCMTDTLRRRAVWWEGHAQGQKDEAASSHRFPEELANPRLLGGQANKSLQILPGRTGRCLARSKHRLSNPAI